MIERRVTGGQKSSRFAQPSSDSMQTFCSTFLQSTAYIPFLAYLQEKQTGRADIGIPEFITLSIATDLEARAPTSGPSHLSMTPLCGMRNIRRKRTWNAHRSVDIVPEGMYS